jgi:hypothetical protein
MLWAWRNFSKSLRQQRSATAGEAAAKGQVASKVGRESSGGSELAIRQVDDGWSMWPVVAGGGADDGKGKGRASAAERFIAALQPSGAAGAAAARERLRLMLDASTAAGHAAVQAREKLCGGRFY